MARNEEKQYGRLNRLWIQKEKEGKWKACLLISQNLKSNQTLIQIYVGKKGRKNMISQIR